MSDERLPCIKDLVYNRWDFLPLVGYLRYDDRNPNVQLLLSENDDFDLQDGLNTFVALHKFGLLLYNTTFGIGTWKGLEFLLSQ